MKNDWIQEYIQNHLEEDIWNYIQNNQERIEEWFGISYQQLQSIVNEVKINYEQKNATDKISIPSKQESELSVEAQILLPLFYILSLNYQKSLDENLYYLLLKNIIYTTKEIFDYWVIECLLSEKLAKVLEYKENCAGAMSGSPPNQNSIIPPIQGSITSHLASEPDMVVFGEQLEVQNANMSPKEINYDYVAGIGNIYGTSINVGSSGQHGSLYSSLSLTKKTNSLPHSGLFIRRNNEFGTRLTIGIKDLINQGILIEQNKIRFDDFIPLNSDEISYPSTGNSLAVSFGIAPIPLNHKRDGIANYYLEIALKTSKAAPKELKKTEAPPVNYIFVIDISGSMDGEKLDAVKASICELFTRMRKNDVIGVIQFDDRPQTLLKATPIDKLKLEKFSEIISSMTADGGTDINVAISFGINEINRYGNNGTSNHIYLFSDGNPTSGETDWIKIRQNVDVKTRGNLRISTFAFGSDANLRELDALAGLTGGKSTFVTSPEDIQISLNEELSRREHLAAINVQFQIEIEPDITISYLYGHDQITDPARREAVLQEAESAKNKAQKEVGVISEPDLITQEKGIRIFVPDLAVGETYWVVFELGIPEGKTQAPVGKATVQYVDTFTRQNQKHELQLAFTGNLPPDLIVEHALALRTSEVAFYTLDDLYEQDLDTAKKRIENHIHLLRSVNEDLSSEQLADDIVTLGNFLSLAENLGRGRLISDVSLMSHSVSPQNLLIHSLSSFGRVRNGFNRVDC